MSPVRILLFALLALTGCAPRIQNIGPPIDQPSFSDQVFHTSDGVDLPVKTWVQWHGDASRAPTGIILALHGFNDHSGGLALPGSALSRRGFSMLACDQGAFGCRHDHGT